MRFLQQKPIIAVVVFASCCIMTACASQPGSRHSSPVISNATIPPTSWSNTSGASTHSKSILARLTKQFHAWHGVPYKLGGNDKRGIDCSGFVHVALKKGLGVTVPRSTTLLAKSGKSISSKKLRPGDLVFFKTGSGKHHVGIYLENGQFMHASTSKGVMKSSMRNPYWRKHYWKSARIL